MALRLAHHAPGVGTRLVALGMRSFVILGGTALASGEFSLEDLPATSGRLDVLVRSLRAALLVSHGVRRDSVAYLVLGGGERSPRTVRVDGATAKFLRPDERSLAILLKKSLLAPVAPDAEGFLAVRPGIAIARGGLEAVLAELGGATHCLLEPGGADLRSLPLASPSVAFYLGDHAGLSDDSRALLRSAGALSVSVGPVELHTEDVVTVVSNELDRRAQPVGGAPRREPAV